MGGATRLDLSPIRTAAPGLNEGARREFAVQAMEDGRSEFISLHFTWLRERCYHRPGHIQIKMSLYFGNNFDYQLWRHSMDDIAPNSSAPHCDHKQDRSPFG